MQTATPIRSRTQATFVVSLMFGLWLQVLALTVSPHFHEWLHADSHSAGHECPVTLLSKGNLILDSGSEITVAAPTADVCLCAAETPFFLPSAEYRLSHSRAPPCC